ncbi:MAG: DUF1569 domain-containing protein [Planctomycetaceae bacterium]|nr:DUF1569 domain-containing protein [Planctomycetaceae bacterium]
MNEPDSAGRRTLHFATIEELLDEIDRIVEADQAGRIRTLGSWTPGQILGHVAAWIEYGYAGYPMKPVPWFVRFLLRRQLKKYMKQGMPSGVRIPRVAEGTYGTEDMPVEQAAERLRLALGRLQRREPAKFDSPAFGRMSDDDRVRLNLMHAELHLSFLQF